MVPGKRRQKVRTFATATPLLLELRHWLVCHGVPRCSREPGRCYWAVSNCPICSMACALPW
jgi:hypothetical protein